MKNLLKETLQVLKDNDLTEKDVSWVGSLDHRISWSRFKVLANKDYDNGYGGQQVCTDLLVVGKDWWLERHEYDGSEWWEFKKHPQGNLEKEAFLASVFSDRDCNDTISTVNNI